MKQKVISTTMTVVLFAAGVVVAADELPKPQAFARYEPMMKRSPFAVATAVALPAATPNFAKDLYIANAARTPDGDLVTLASSADKNFKKYLSTKVPVEGYSVPSIEWSDRVGATKVTISKDGQFATLTFNQALLTQSVANAGPQPVPVQPQPQPQGVGVPAVPQYAAPPNAAMKGAPASVLPTPPPRVRGVIQRNPTGKAEPQPQPQPPQLSVIDE